MVTIRPFETKDLRSIVHIESSVFPNPWSAQSFLDCAQWKEFWFHVAVMKKQIVGYFVAQVVETEAELHNIAVDPAFQRKGIGKELMKHFLERIGTAGVQDIFLMVRPSNEAAIHLYESAGFCFLERRPKYYEDTKEDALIFYKSLDTDVKP